VLSIDATFVFPTHIRTCRAHFASHTDNQASKTGTLPHPSRQLGRLSATTLASRTCSKTVPRVLRPASIYVARCQDEKGGGTHQCPSFQGPRLGGLRTVHRRVLKEDERRGCWERRGEGGFVTCAAS